MPPDNADSRIKCIMSNAATQAAKGGANGPTSRHLVHVPCPLSDGIHGRPGKHDRWEQQLVQDLRRRVFGDD